MKVKTMPKTKTTKRDAWLVTTLVPTGMILLSLLIMGAAELGKHAGSSGFYAFGNQAFAVVFFLYLLSALPLGTVALGFSIFRIFKKETLKWSVTAALVSLFHIVFGGAMLILLIQMLANLHSV